MNIPKVEIERFKKGISKRKLSEETGIPYRTIQNIMSGGSTSYENMKLIAMELGKEVEELWGY